ncbi:MAG: phytase [Pseudoxanthomonas suwonensis]|nr:phytase [Pseudoxanthomonas suwonensis]
MFLDPSPRPLALALAITLGLAACDRQPSTPVTADSDARVSASESADVADLVTVAEAFSTVMTPEDNIDSLASWRAGDGAVWVLATAKSTDKLVVYDGQTGETLRSFGVRGDGPGQFKRPNGIVIADDLAFVIERDNRRVQVLRLPSFEPLLSFGTDELVKPYGGWVDKTDGGYALYVTDSYTGGTDGLDKDIAPPLTELDRRVRHYRVTVDGTTANATLVGTYGDTSELGALRVVESLWGDAANNRLLIAEEDEEYANEVKVYDLEGNFTGQVIGKETFQAQAEGLSLKTCGDGSGWWIGTQQGKDHSVFHLFERQSFAHVGSFRGAKVANTDGIWLDPQASERFPEGALYAVHDDQGAVAFDWRALATALSLPKCAAE